MTPAQASQTDCFRYMKKRKMVVHIYFYVFFKYIYSFFYYYVACM